MRASNIDVSALWVRRDSVYKTLGVDSWDIDRDAMQWPGGNSCIVHPPCRAWGKLKHFSKHSDDEKIMAIYAVECVRLFGGVLEHPQGSALWKDRLPLPGTIDIYGGYSILIDQSWFGHKAKKRTFLYIVGCRERDLPEIPISFDAIEHCITSSKRKNSIGYILKEISKSDRERTPVALAKWLINVALLCNKNRVDGASPFDRHWARP